MKRLAILLCLLTPCGCGKVLGYYPTEAELDAIQRGEDPRANESGKPAPKPKESDRPRDSSGGLEGSGKERGPNSSGAGGTGDEARDAGPGSGVVLRWIDCTLLIVEGEGKRERVRIPGASVPTDFAEASDALNKMRETYPSGTKLVLAYPLKSQDGKSIVYRNKDGDLLAQIARKPD